MLNYLEWYKDGKIIDNSYIWKYYCLRGWVMNIIDYYNIEIKIIRCVLFIVWFIMEDFGIYMCWILLLDIVKKIVYVLDGELLGFNLVVEVENLLY